METLQDKINEMQEMLNSLNSELVKSVKAGKTNKASNKVELILPVEACDEEVLPKGFKPKSKTLKHSTSKKPVRPKLNKAELEAFSSIARSYHTDYDHCPWVEASRAHYDRKEAGLEVCLRLWADQNPSLLSASAEKMLEPTKGRRQRIRAFFGREAMGMKKK